MRYFVYTINVVFLLAACAPGYAPSSEPSKMEQEERLALQHIREASNHLETHRLEDIFLVTLNDQKMTFDPSLRSWVGSIDDVKFTIQFDSMDFNAVPEPYFSDGVIDEATLYGHFEPVARKFVYTIQEPVSIDVLISNETDNVIRIDWTKSAWASSTQEVNDTESLVDYNETELVTTVIPPSQAARERLFLKSVWAQTGLFPMWGYICSGDRHSLVLSASHNNQALNYVIAFEAQKDVGGGC